MNAETPSSPAPKAAVRPVCFMVMPFRRKTVTGAREGAPSEVDFDRLWDLAYRPALDALGYLPVRADAETGSVIIKDMLNRLKHAHLVVADVSIGNANVYYEVGIRHAARDSHCVLLAADWSRQLFDVEQLRTLRYPLADGAVPEEQAKAIREFVVKALPAMVHGRSPFHELVTEDEGEAFADEAVRIGAFQAELTTLRLLRDRNEQQTRLRALLTGLSEAALGMPAIAVELIHLVRDVLGDNESGWEAVVELIESLPEQVRRLEAVEEQRLLARSYLGAHEEAIAGLRALIDLAGPTPERCGLLGGRYKRLWREARARRLADDQDRASLEERQNLKRAIEAYEQGMQLDLNEYYCSCNLPALIRSRGKEGDDELARNVDTLVVAACRRAEELGTGDEWLFDTLLGAAFRSGDVATVEELADELDAGALWRTHSTLSDARDWIELAPEESRVELRDLLHDLEKAFKPEAPENGDG